MEGEMPNERRICAKWRAKRYQMKGEVVPNEKRSCAEMKGETVPNKEGRS